jgi:hypothetical protein
LTDPGAVLWSIGTEPALGWLRTKLCSLAPRLEAVEAFTPSQGYLDSFGDGQGTIPWAMFSRTKEALDGTEVGFSFVRVRVSILSCAFSFGLELVALKR